MHGGRDKEEESRCIEMDLGASLVLVASLFPPILYCKTDVGPHP